MWLVDRIQHLVPSFDGGDDFIRVLGPSKGSRVGVGLGEEAIDGGLQLDDGSEHAAFEPPLGELREEAFDGVEPGCRSGGEVEGPARVPLQPGADLRMLVGGVVVGNGLDQFAGRHGGLDGIEEADELLMSVMLHATADYLAVQHVKGRKQGCGAMPDVVMLVWTATDGIDMPE